ncbi:MAG: S8 family serine peptidase [Polyangiaceae bacterium]|nr:S8 family serine peptidase [Polyangiaceae bacterium]
MAPMLVNFDGTNHIVWSGTSYYANSNSAGVAFGGTSAASPMVAGSAARVLDGFKSIGWGQTARTLRLNLLLMGDAAQGPSTDLLSGVDSRGGSGDFFHSDPSGHTNH